MVVVNRTTVVEFGVNDGGSSDRGCFGIEVRADAAELMNMITTGFGERWSKKVRCSSDIKSSLRTGYVVLCDELCVSS